MSNIIFRKGEHVLLRPLEPEDAPTIQPWMNDPEVTQYLMRVFPIPLAVEVEWINGLYKRENEVVLGIVTVADSKLIGSIGLHQINWRHRTANTGTVIGEKECWGKGYGTEAKMLLLDLAFNALDLFVIQSKVLAHNGRSLAYGRKCGYEEVGRLPQWFRSQTGERVDEVILTVTQERWRPLWAKYLKARKQPE